MKKGLAMHCHHDKLFECVYDYQERVDYIKAHKPQEEQELRLRLFQMMPDALTPGIDSDEWGAYLKACDAYGKARDAYNKVRDALTKAWDACDKAWGTCDKACDAYDKARDAYNKKYAPELEKLHKEICPDCPWDGKTIFGGKK